MSSSNAKIIFVHISKTAGTTLRTILKNHFGKCDMYQCNENLSAYYNRLKKATDTNKINFNVLMGHIPFGFRPALPDDFKYITVLRDPFDRVESMFQHIKRTKKNYYFQKLRNKTFEQALKMELPPLNNEMVRILCGQRDLIPRMHQNGPVHKQEVILYDKGLLDQAKRNLKEFAVVGFTEHFNEFIANLNKTFNKKISNFKTLNQRKDKRIRLDGNLKSLIQKYNQMDIELYDWAYETFFKNVANNVKQQQTKQITTKMNHQSIRKKKRIMCEQRGGRIGHKFYDYLSCIILKNQYDDLNFVYNVDNMIQPILGRLPEDVSGPGRPIHKLNLRERYLKQYSTPYWTGILLRDFDTHMKSLMNNKNVDTISLENATRVNINSIDYNTFRKVVEELRERYQIATQSDIELPANVFHIAVHIRRGDILRFRFPYKWDMVESEYYINNLSVILRTLREDFPELYGKALVTICTDSKDHPDIKKIVSTINRDFDKIKLELSSKSQYEDFDHIVKSHLIVVGNSSFSTTAGLIGKGIKVYNNRNVFRILQENAKDHIISDCLLKEKITLAIKEMYRTN